MLNSKTLTLIGAFVLFVTLTWPCLAESSGLELTLSQALHIAFENNLNFKLATLDWQAAKAKLERAQIVGDAEMLLEAEKEWEGADQAYFDKKRELKSLVRTSYYGLLERENAVHNAKTAKERAEAQLAMDKKKYEAGLVSALDLKRVQNSLLEANYRYERALVDLDTQAMLFNEILGLPLQQEVVLTERLLLDFIPFTYDLETCFELALALDSGVADARERLAQAQEEALLAQSPFVPRAELEQAIANAEKAQIELRQAEQALYFQIRAEYYALMDHAHALEVAEHNITLERQALKAEESKYAAGVISNAQIVAQQENLAKLEQDYSASLLNYSLARIQLLQRIGQYEELGEDNESSRR